MSIVKDVETGEVLYGGIPEEVFAIGILNKDYHERLLSDIDRVAAVAGIPTYFVWSRLSQYCTDEDVAWVKKMRAGNDHGLAYVGTSDKPVLDRMMAITGACLRNYTDARMMSVQDVIRLLKAGDMPSPTVLLIPNFCLGASMGGNIPSWEVSSLLGLLYSRLAKNLKTVLYVESLAVLEKGYGAPFRQHIESHYSVI